MPEIPPRPRHVPPALVLALGFAAMILAGTVLLVLPISSASGAWTPLLVALFTATSAVCVTGLVVVDTGTYWSLFGQIVILLLIQAGGFGFMTTSTLLLLLVGHRASLRERILIGEALGTGHLGTVLPLVRRVVLFTLIAEGAGALLLAVRFLLDQQSLPRALWWSLFHSVSAFNNAGFDVIGGYRSLTIYNADLLVLGVIGLLIIVGGLGYTVVEDIWTRRSWKRLSLDSKIVVATSAMLLGGGTLVLLLLEHDNPATLGPMSVPLKLLNAWFSAVVPRTAGFNSIDVGRMSEAALVTTVALMFIGGASGSTAGGIKVNTFSLLFFAILSTLRGRDRVEAFQREVPTVLVMRGLSIALLAVALVYGVSLGLAITEQQRYLALLFEATSAFGTVGLSTGITPQLDTLGRILLIVTMYTGRLGPLTLALALARRPDRQRFRWAQETIKIG